MTPAPSEATQRPRREGRGEVETITAEEYLALPQQAPRKYRNVPTVVDGITFDSKAEARRFSELKLMLAAGEIAYIRRQPTYALTVNGIHIAKYVADFQYFDVATETTVVEDTKSPATKTPVYRLKKKLMKAIHGIEITEIEA